MSELRQYELVYVVSPGLEEDGVTELHAQVEKIVSDLGGRIEKTENLGRRRLAYEIGKHRDGTYVVDLIEAPGEIVKELDRKMKVLESVLRHLVVRVDEDIRKSNRARQIRQTRRQRRLGLSEVVPVDGPAVQEVPPPPAESKVVDPPVPDVVETGAGADKVGV